MQTKHSVLLLLLLLVSGCQDNPRGRKAVSGTVKFKGELLKTGSIEFRPSPGSPGIATGAIIQAGNYEIPASKGLPNGTYQVRLNSTEADKTPPEPGSEPVNTKNAVELIPPEFNTRTTQQISVTDDGTTVFNFDIP